ncbi:CotD family spore coat protein [Geomicrobium sp. JCM 19039]|uniref:CotD family spore coat protein n=1 Tax=Geomicrobium sp. JCM 19039 TaxID=1460636 RepID=UPI00045F195D|nr:CotD family spore coat protein [Geomicrobium sp. JCM 19039]GAK11109.1 inner spore coat protein D [Geomicrobium sp. JCM 19039]
MSRHCGKGNFGGYGNGNGCNNQPIVLPAVVHPTKCDTSFSNQEYIIPEVHPSHHTHVHKDVYKHVHSHPHTNENLYECETEQYDCGPGNGMVGGQMMNGNGHMGGHHHKGKGCGHRPW